jgi:hypothetical protein
MCQPATCCAQQRTVRMDDQDVHAGLPARSFRAAAALGRLHVRRSRDAEGGRDVVGVFEQMVADDQATFRPSPAVARTVDRRRESERRDEYCADGSTRDPTCK